MQCGPQSFPSIKCDLSYTVHGDSLTFPPKVSEVPGRDFLFSRDFLCFLQWWHCCSNITSAGSRGALGSLPWPGLWLSLCHQLLNTKPANVRHQPPSQHRQSTRESSGSLVQCFATGSREENLKQLKSKQHLLQNLDTIHLWILWLYIALTQLKSYFVMVM